MNVAFIPVRGGSKSIPLKNIKEFAGKPLVYWTLQAAVECEDIDKIVVATDSDRIKDIVLAFGFSKVNVIGRGSETATDVATTESAMLEFAEKYEFDNIVLIQATSPLLTAKDITNGIEALSHSDSVLSVVRQKRFLWEQDDYAKPLNYDYMSRPRRQDFHGFLVENGAFYMTSREALLRTKCRISGNIKAVEMSEESYIEIDEKEDWVIAETLLRRRNRKHKRMKKVKMFLADCDGTLTDGSMYYTADGDTMKRFHTYDGVGLRLLKERGIITGIVTSENSEIVRKRGEKLGVDEILTGIQDKVKAVKKLCEKYGIVPEEVAYMGDDWNDVALLKEVGMAVCPANAIPEIQEMAMYVTKCSGGNGAVREAAEYLLTQI